jgi:hypothetical protein
MSSAGTPSTLVSAARAPAPCRTSACAPLRRRQELAPARLDRGFTPSYETSYHGLKPPRLSAALGRSDLRQEADLPQVRRLQEDSPPMIGPG